MSESFDFAIVGGGVIGLSLARELANSGSVVVIDRQPVGREASWAGAGILPPHTMVNAVHARDKLAALSFQLHEQWADHLREESGIDTGFQKCGAMFVARTAGEVAALNGQVLEWQENRINVTPMSSRQATEQMPTLVLAADDIWPRRLFLMNLKSVIRTIWRRSKNRVTFAGFDSWRSRAIAN